MFNSHVFSSCHRLRDSQVKSIQMVSNRIYDLQKVGQYELQHRQIFHCMTYMMVKKADLSQTVFVRSTNEANGIFDLENEGRGC